MLAFVKESYLGSKARPAVLKTLAVTGHSTVNHWAALALACWCHADSKQIPCSTYCIVLPILNRGALLMCYVFIDSCLLVFALLVFVLFSPLNFQLEVALLCCWSPFVCFARFGSKGRRAVLRILAVTRPSSSKKFDWDGSVSSNVTEQPWPCEACHQQIVMHLRS